VSLTDLNAQAMIFVPARRVLQFATGGSGHPAALSAWRELDATALLSGRALTDAVITDIGKVTMPLHHCAHGE